MVFGAVNPYKEYWRNVQSQYENMRQIVLRMGYDEVWIVESDMLPPKDALQKLREVGAPVVGGLYVIRHGANKPNVMQWAPGVRSVGESMKWKEIKKHWGKTIPSSGVCMGCVLVQCEVLKGCEMTAPRKVWSDLLMMEYCVAHDIPQMARLDVICGHREPGGNILWPQDFI